MTPDLRTYDVILINTSAGKDSQAMLDLVVNVADQAGVRDRLVAVHCDLGRVEWEGTRDLAERQASHYGVRFEVVKRPQGDLLEHVESRGKWPGPDTRYCTSDHKRGQVYTLMTRLAGEVRARVGNRQVRILDCLGLRAEESPKRAKKPELETNKKASNKTVRRVDTWLPIKHWSTAEVWGTIRRSGVEHHRAYDLGMPRLSCCFCIFAPESALLLAGSHNRELLDEYVRIEQKIKHTFTVDRTLANIQAKLASGFIPGPVTTWMDCA